MASPKGMAAICERWRSWVGYTSIFSLIHVGQVFGSLVASAMCHGLISEAVWVEIPGPRCADPLVHLLVCVADSMVRKLASLNQVHSEKKAKVAARPACVGKKAFESQPASIQRGADNTKKARIGAALVDIGDREALKEINDILKNDREQILPTLSFLKGRYIVRKNRGNKKDDNTPWPDTYVTWRQVPDWWLTAWFLGSCGLPEAWLAQVKRMGSTHLRNILEYLTGVHADDPLPRAALDKTICSNYLAMRREALGRSLGQPHILDAMVASGRDLNWNLQGVGCWSVVFDDDGQAFLQHVSGRRYLQRGVPRDATLVVRDNFSDRSASIKDECLFVDFFEKVTSNNQQSEWPTGYRGFFDVGVDEDIGVLVQAVKDREEEAARGRIEVGSSSLVRELRVPSKGRRNVPLAIGPPAPTLAIEAGPRTLALANNSEAASSTAPPPATPP